MSNFEDSPADHAANVASAVASQHFNGVNPAVAAASASSPPVSPSTSRVPPKNPNRNSVIAGSAPLSANASSTGFNPVANAANAIAAGLAENRRHKGFAPGGKVKVTDYPAIANAPLPAEGNGSFSNVTLAALIWFAPAVLIRLIPFIKASWISWKLYFLIGAITGVPVAIAYWTVMSHIGPRKNDKVELPGKPIETYIDIHDASLKRKYNGSNKIPMQTFHDAYFDGKIDVKGDMLDVLEYRLDWAAMHFTPELFKFVLTTLIPDVISHSAREDMKMVRDHYDRGNDFYEWFLGPQMIYTSGMISDPLKKETLEELQDNKLAAVCSKLALEPTDKVLDIGCGWGTLTAFAAKNFGCDVTGVTLAKEQTKFGNDRIAKNGLDSSKARILCMDYRDIPVDKGHYNKIVSLEMAEHVGIKHYSGFLRDVYERLDDDGTFLLQVAGLRPSWQYWDLIWGLFMNKYIFRGADASCSLGWVINKLEGAGFEVRSADVLGVHYSATIHRWYENWKANEAKVKAKYGEKLYRVWLFFLASSVIIAREGGSSVFQITCTKNLNATHRVEGVFSHNVHPKPARPFQSVYQHSLA